MSKSTKIIAAVLLSGAVTLFGDVVDFNQHTVGWFAGGTNVPNTSQTGPSGFRTNLLNSSGTASGFEVVGRYNPATGGNGIYNIAFNNAGGNNYLNMQVGDGSGTNNGQGAALVASTGSYSLKDNWEVSMSFSAAPLGAGSGTVNFGLYNAGVEASDGSYELTNVQGATPMTALQLSINGATGVIRVNYANTATTLVQLKPDVIKDEYNLTDGATHSLVFRCVNEVLSVSLDGGTEYSVAVADLGGQIGDNVRFAGGDIIQNGTYNWDMNVYELSAIPEASTIGLFLVACGSFCVRRFMR